MLLVWSWYEKGWELRTVNNGNSQISRMSRASKLRISLQITCNHHHHSVYVYFLYFVPIDKDKKERKKAFIISINMSEDKLRAGNCWIEDFLQKCKHSEVLRRRKSLSERENEQRELWLHEYGNSPLLNICRMLTVCKVEWLNQVSSCCVCAHAMRCYDYVDYGEWKV